MTPEVPLQHNMFTGELDDTRTRHQQQLDHSRRFHQQAMFASPEMAQFGVRTRPLMSLDTKMAFFSEEEAPPNDTTADEIGQDLEEIERALQREAEALTTPMFAQEPNGQNGQQRQAEAVGGAAISTPEQPQEAEPIPTVAPPQPPKLTAYLDVVRAMQEQLTTLWIDPLYEKHFSHQLAETILDAHTAGLTRAEINAAVKIGEHLGKRQRRDAPDGASQTASIPKPPPLPEKQNSAGVTVIYAASQNDQPRTLTREGYRRRARRAQLGLRGRSGQQAA